MTDAIVGRENELARLDEFVSAAAGDQLLALVGEPGVGKSTLLEAAVASAAQRGWSIAQVQASSADASIPYAGLADLVDAIADVAPAALPGLPVPQRHALDVALYRDQADGVAPERLALSQALLSLLRGAADSSPVLLVVDDVQWLDEATAHCLAYAVRRVPVERARVLTAGHDDAANQIADALPRGSVADVRVDPLGDDAIERLVSAHTTQPMPQRVLRRLLGVAHGNPLFALELARAAEVAQVGSASLPVPTSARSIFGPRVAALSDELRGVLLTLALAGAVTRQELEAACGAEAVADATGLGLVQTTETRARAAHPLLAATAQAMSADREQRALHRALADVVTNPTARARHLALATVDPDPVTAGVVAEAAVVASEHGATEYALELSSHALRLTAADDVERPGRVIRLARYQLVTGHVDRAVELLEQEFESLPSGVPRAQAHIILGEAASFEDDLRRMDLALDESDAGEIVAVASARKAMLSVVGQLEDLDESEKLAEAALVAADGLDSPAAVRRARAILAWIHVLRGREVEGAADVLPEESVGYEESIARPVGVQHAFRGEVESARRILLTLFDQAEANGQAASILAMSTQLAELELRVGDIESARHWFAQLPLIVGMEQPETLRVRVEGDIAAVRGDAETAIAAGVEVLATPDLQGWETVAAHRLMGLAYLAAGQYDDAAEHLGDVWRHCEREGVDEPGVFPVAGDLVEALVALGRASDATKVVDRLAKLAVEQRHPWGSVTAARCAALVALGSAYDVHEVERLREAAATYADLGLRFDQARTLLALGRIHRRAGKRSLARESLEESARLLDELGCDGWAEAARQELGSVSGRRRSHDGQLTDAELRVAQLAAGGLSNRDIAEQLHVTVHTVEAHLSHAYAKLGIRSRSQLIQHLPRL